MIVNELFGRTQAMIRANIAQQMVRCGSTYEEVGRELSSDTSLVRFLNSSCLLIVYWGTRPSIDDEKVWIVNLDR